MPARSPVFEFAAPGGRGLPNARECSLHPMQGGTLFNSKELTMDDILSYFETNDTEGFKINSMVW